MSEREFFEADTLPMDADPNQVEEFVNELLDQLSESFPPGTPQQHSSVMTTDDFFLIIDQHAPDMLSMSDLALRLRQKGYQSWFDKSSNQFAWLINQE